MMADAARRRFDVLLFWALDGFSREGAPETHTHLKWLDHARVRFRSLTEPYLDSCGVFRDAVVSILGVIAKQERIRITTRRYFLISLFSGMTAHQLSVGQRRMSGRTRP
jgi:DNA invertase Pin-like site-specific DNA recombinase